VAGRLTINGSSPKGVYTQCGRSEHFDSSGTAEYLLKNPNYHYAWTKVPFGDDVNSAVRFQDIGNPFIIRAIMRAEISFRNSTFVTIGTRSTELAFSYESFFDPVTNRTRNNNGRAVDVLTCSLVPIPYDGRSNMCGNFNLTLK
jgi:hypothetical protein